jgi:hypothetical protein
MTRRGRISFHALRRGARRPAGPCGGHASRLSWHAAAVHALLFFNASRPMVGGPQVHIT